MPHRTSFIRRITIAVSAVLGITGLALIFAHANRSQTVRAYFGLEGMWIEHWPFERGRREIQKLVPVMCRIGVLGPVRMEVEPGVSFLLDPRDLVPVTILRTGKWQPEVWDSLSPALSEGGVLLDVGAHIGYFSMKAALKVGKSGRVLAFEPNPETLKLLRDNVTANHAQNVIVEPIACTDHEQMLTLYAAPAINTGASSLARQNAQISADEAPRPYLVPGRPIDDVVRELNLTRVDAIKVDVEGAEVYVLRGAVNTLKRFHPKLVVEMMPAQLAQLHTTPDDLIAVIRGAGYNLRKPLNPEKSDWEWTAQRNLATTVRMADISAFSQLIDGFYELEQDAWRWTGRRFSVALRTPPGATEKGAWLILNFYVPDQAFHKLKSITLSATVGGATIAPETFATPGTHEYRRAVPPSALNREVVDAQFSVDKIMPLSRMDRRELGVVATSVGLESK